MQDRCRSRHQRSGLNRATAAAALAVLLLVSSCASYHSREYDDFYSYLQPSITHCAPPSDCRKATDCFLCIYTDARHLDYTNNYCFMRSLAKHPSDRSKTRDFGHCWIYLQGMVDGQCVFIEGGHSGETGICQAKYFDGIMNYHDFGYANPTRQQLAEGRFEPNPVRYLWEERCDGFFEWGPGRHRPTFGVKVPLTEEQFDRILGFIRRYHYSRYALTGNQCSTFAAQIASLAGLELDCETTLRIDPYLCIRGETVRLWCDPEYSILTLATPDTIERSLVEAVRQGRAECVFTRYP